MPHPPTRRAPLRACAALTLLLLAGCGDLYRYVRSGPVGRAIGNAVSGGDTATIRLAELTSFAWDDVWMFNPYSTQKLICARLQLPAPDCASTIDAAGVGEDSVLLVFRRGGRPVHVESHFRANGDFTPAAPGPVRRADAVYRVQNRGGGVSPRLAPVPPAP